MGIQIGFDFNTNKIIKNEEHIINDSEKDILTKIAIDLSLNNYNIFSNTDDYTTLQYKEYDIARIKYTDRTKWIEIFLTKEDKKNNIDNILFETQKNKNKLFWKSIINDEISIYYNFIKNKCNEIDNM